MFEKAKDAVDQPFN